MKRRIKKTAVSLIIFLIIELIVFTKVSAEYIVLTNTKENIIVDRNGNGDYRIIQEAVNNAEPGSTIYVKKGEYNEIIIINKPIRLIGEDRYSTLINPISEKNKYAICLGAPGITIKNFCVKNGAPGLYTSGIRITASNTEISDCNIYNTPVGIAIWTSNNIVNNCNFWGCTDEGIVLIGSSYSECNNNKIINCIFRNNCDGIELQSSSINTISNCDIYDNTHTGIDAIDSSNNKNIITNCRIYKNQVHGIYFYSSSGNNIIDCSIYDNRHGNIIMNKCSEDNQIISNIGENIEEETANKNSKLYYFLSSSSIYSRIKNIISIFKSLLSINF